MSNFLGSHAINMDAKGRLAIPSKVREELAQACGGRIVLTANADEERGLLVYPEPEEVEQVQIDESDLRIEIRPESIGFYESLGELTAIDIASPDDITVTLAMEGEGETWDMQRRFVLSDDGATLTPQPVGEENFEPMPLKKCE